MKKYILYIQFIFLIFFSTNLFAQNRLELKKGDAVISLDVISEHDQFIFDLEMQGLKGCQKRSELILIIDNEIIKIKNPKKFNPVSCEKKSIIFILVFNEKKYSFDQIQKIRYYDGSSGEVFDFNLKPIKKRGRL